MYIFVTYKDPPELSPFRRNSFEEDPSEELDLLVNPKCSVRVMLEYIRAKCKLAASTKFDLCDDQGNAKNMFSFPTYSYANRHFFHKKTYYIVVFTTDDYNKVIALPQVNQENKLYFEIQTKMKKHITGSVVWESSNVLVGRLSKTHQTPTKAGKKK